MAQLIVISAQSHRRGTFQNSLRNPIQVNITLWALKTCSRERTTIVFYCSGMIQTAVNGRGCPVGGPSTFRKEGQHGALETGT